MSNQKHLTPKEFDYFMYQRYCKRRAQEPDQEPIAIGSIILVPGLEDSKLVECCRCGMPIYITPWLYDEISKYRLPWDKTKMPFFCEFCIPLYYWKGVMLQDLAAVKQYTGEK